jgi:hypothetical protein
MYPTATVSTRESRMTVLVDNQAVLCLFSKAHGIGPRQRGGVG